MAANPEPFMLRDVDAWRKWLDTHEHDSDGVWLVLAKKGTTSPTTLTYAEALDEALCSGWIDGQKNSLDTATFLQRFHSPSQGVDVVPTQRRHRRASH